MPPIVIGMMRDAAPGMTAVAFHVAAKAYGADFVYITPKDVDIRNKKINGRTYVDGKWVRSLMEYPDVIDNGENFLNTDAGKELAAKVPYTNHRLGGKEVVCGILDAAPELREYVIPYEIITSPEAGIEFIRSAGSAVIKPVLGSSGKGVLMVTARAESAYEISHDSHQEMMTRDGLLAMLTATMRGKKHIIQKYICSRTPSGIPYDVRVHTCRGMDGLWKTAKIYARLGINKNVTSNVAGGGAIADARDLLENSFGGEGVKLYEEILRIRDVLPDVLQRYYAHPLSALGIDIGIDRGGKVYIFEVNAGPGSKFLFLEHALLVAGYALHVRQNHSREPASAPHGKNPAHEAPTLPNS